MSDLREMIKESKIAKKELVASTIRMSKEQQSFIDELTDYLGFSKQEVMLSLLEEGIKVAESELKLDDENSQIEEANYYLLNTNKKNNAEDTATMLANAEASAFYGHWKDYIDVIKKNDVVFLYENGVGIIAYGVGTGNTKIRDYYGDKDECHYQKLQEFRILGKPIKASDIKKILNRNVVFLRTMVGLNDGDKLVSHITNNT